MKRDNYPELTNDEYNILKTMYRQSQSCYGKMKATGASIDYKEFSNNKMKELLQFRRDQLNNIEKVL